RRGAFLALFLPGILLKALILLMFIAHHHSEKQRDNSGKTANYQRLSATMFFRCPAWPLFLICSHRPHFQGGWRGKFSPAPRPGRTGRPRSSVGYKLECGTALGRNSAKRL